MAVNVSHVEAALGKSPFTTEPGMPKSILLKDLAMFLTNTRPALLRPDQQKALVPVAAEISTRTTEIAIAKQFNVSPGAAEITYKKHLDDALLGKRDVIITEEQLTRAIARVLELDPRRDRKQLEKLGALSDRYSAIMRNKQKYGRFASEY